MKLIPGIIVAGPIANRGPDGVCELAAEAGIEAVEVCTGTLGAAEGQELRALVDDWDRAARARGMHVAALNCSFPPDAVTDVREVFVVAAERGLRRVKVDVSPYDVRLPYEPLLAKAREHWRRVADDAAALGLRALAEVHPKIVCHSPSAMWRLLEGLPSEAVGAILDPGNMVVEGWEDMHESVDILGPYLAHVHVKNACWQRSAAGKWESVGTALDDGFVDWPEVCRQLARVGYEGYGIIEFLCPFMDNLPWVRHDVEVLRQAARDADPSSCAARM